jgi:hypothetical protein
VGARRLITLFAAALIGAGLTACDAALAPAGPHAPASGPAQAGPVRVFSQWLDESRVRSTTRAQWAAIARHNQIVVLNSWDYRLIPILKRANPRVQVWVYKDLSGVRSDDCATASGQCGSCPPGVHDSRFLSSGMGYCWVMRHHPDWILHSVSTGQRLQFRGYPGIWETNYGSGAYQRQWLRNVLTDVKAHGWNGVQVDNALTTARAYGVSARYRTDAAVQAATYSAIKTIGPGLHAAGVRSVFNVGYATRFPGLWQRWLGPADGLMQEFYLSSSARAGAVGRTWASYQSEVASCVARHKSCWFHTGSYSPAVTAQASAYALASYLLAADGRQYLAAGEPTPAPVARCASLGTPTGGMLDLGVARSRNYSGGIVVVNPSQIPISISLGRSYFARAQPTSVLTMAPGTAAILGGGPGQGCR